MRLWSLHPQYLDAKGIVALWREGLLAKAVLEGKTRGYTHHPQLFRFKEAENPVTAINAYLTEVLKESVVRGYRFSSEKIVKTFQQGSLPLSSGQLEYEWQHLMKKLSTRAPQLHEKWHLQGSKMPHPIFSVHEGPIAPWEMLTK